MEPDTILFDGFCHLCNGSVDFILKRDSRGRFAFSPLNSLAARQVLERFEVDSPLDESIVLIDDDGVHTHSDAVVRIARGLGFPWKLLSVALILPKTVRDRIYGLVARNRHRWFGRREVCRIPTPAERNRFLETTPDRSRDQSAPAG